MKAKELRSQSTATLKDQLAQLEDTQFRLRLQHYTGQLKAVSSLGDTRREIARIKTLLREREQFEQVQEALTALEDPATPGRLRDELQGDVKKQAQYTKLKRQHKQLSAVTQAS